MTFRISRSVINGLSFNFEEAVEAHRQEKMAHRFTGNAAPHATGIVEQAVRRVQYPIEDQKPDDFVAAYEIVDDVTPADHRAVLVTKLHQAQAEALKAIISPARERLLHLDAVAAPENSELRDRLIEQISDIGARKAVVQRYFTMLEIDLEDLADDEIDGWAFKPLGGQGVT